MRANELHDEEFGAITIRRRANAKYIRLTIAANGRLTASMPTLAPLFMLKKLLHDSREQLRSQLTTHQSLRPKLYRAGDRVGASHHIVQVSGPIAGARVGGLEIRWTVPPGSDSTSPYHQDIVRKAVRKALDKEAKAYLPRQLTYLAGTHGFHFASIRYSNAKGRWGSCSSRGVISLNVALMNLPMQHIDYVLLHELAHTRHLNHSTAFWSEVARCCPAYRQLRQELKSYSPYL